MRYLALIRPSSSLRKMLSEEPHLAKSGSGLHCTIWTFDMNEREEGRFVSHLEKRAFNKFNLEVVGTADFEEESKVLLLSRPPEIMALHERFVEIARWFAKSSASFEDSVRMYGLGRYSPHITVPGVGKNSLKNNYSGVRMDVPAYYLNKKKDEKWINVKSFPLV